LAVVGRSIPRNQRMSRRGCSLVGDRLLLISSPLANRVLRRARVSESSGTTACASGCGELNKPKLLCQSCCDAADNVMVHNSARISPTSLICSEICRTLQDNFSDREVASVIWQCIKGVIVDFGSRNAQQKMWRASAAPFNFFWVQAT